MCLLTHPQALRPRLSHTPFVPPFPSPPPSGITRALCASFPEGTEPALCNEQWVSDNECETLAVGYTKCRVG